MNPKPLVSICIPCHNAAPYIGAALDSVLAQTWKKLEIIVVNDGSTDGSAEVLERYREHGVRVINQDNRGQCAAANRAFAESTGDYIKFFDADDLLSPEMIERQMARLNGRTDAVASAEWGRFHGNLSTFKSNPQSVWRNMEPTEWLVEAWSDARPMMQCALWLIPRPILVQCGGWDEELSLINDFEFFARVLCHAKEVLFTPDAVLYYRSGISGSLGTEESQCRRVPVSLSPEGDWTSARPSSGPCGQALLCQRAPGLYLHLLPRSCRSTSQVRSASVGTWGQRSHS